MPGFDLLIVVVFVVFIITVAVFVEVVVFVFVVWVFDGMFKNVTTRHFVTYDTGSAAGAGAAAFAGAAAAAGAAAGFGGGYVVQKWRPHLLQTQNWSGVQSIPGPGSRISMAAPQR